MNPFDLQVNGYAGTDFNSDNLSAAALHRSCAALHSDGVDSILATIITDSVPKMTARLRRIAELREQDPDVHQIIRGFHIEGPFISPSPGYVGAHPAAEVQPANLEPMKRLLDAAMGLTRLVTLAPEHDDHFHVTRFLAEQGITVSAGHCNPSFVTLTAACDHGLSMVTHLGNGCPLELPRHDNFIQHCLALHEKLWLCFIPDGVHIPFFALRNYLRCIPLDKVIFVTDAISAASLGPGRHRLGGWDLEIGPDLVARLPNGQLCGSTVTLPRILSLATPHLGLNEAELTQVLDTNPRRAVPLQCSTA